MNININISNINKHFFCSIKKYNNDVKNKIHNTKLVNYCFYSINEANISDIIKKILYYSNKYQVVEYYDFINISQLNDTYIEKIKIDENKRYLIFTYNNDSLIDFNDFLLNLYNPKVFILNTIESFSYILDSLIELTQNNICFFNLSPQNIVFNLDCGVKPQLKNFQLSLQVSKLNISYITNIIEKIDNYTHKPIEVHVLFYLIKNNIYTISYSLIQEICEVFNKQLTILSLFSEKIKNDYKEKCIESLKKYINKPKEEIIQEIIQQNDKWDVYSISMIYLHIFGNISRIFSLKEDFITKLITELYKNISPEPSYRNSLEILNENYNKLINNVNNWSFINKLEYNKMIMLFEILEK